MARGRKTGGRNFVKGVVTNPNGRPKVPEHVKEFRKMHKVQVTEMLEKYCYSTRQELIDALKNPDTPIVEVNVIKILLEGAKSGDYKRFDFILDRTIGKVKEEVEYSGSMHGELIARLENET